MMAYQSLAQVRLKEERYNAITLHSLASQGSSRSIKGALEKLKKEIR